MNNLLIILVSTVAGILTYAISIILNKGTVFASAIVTLISGIIFPYFYPEKGAILMAVAACASYAGMVSIKNIPKITEMAILSSIVGILFIVTINGYLGVGGRLGTIASLSYFTWLGIKKAYSKLTNQTITTNEMS